MFVIGLVMSSICALATTLFTHLFFVIALIGGRSESGKVTNGYVDRLYVADTKLLLLLLLLILLFGTVLLKVFYFTASFYVFVGLLQVLCCYIIRRPIRVCDTFGVSASLSLNSPVKFSLFW